jgi:co-chaperonin GroES (HSP10)
MENDNLTIDQTPLAESVSSKIEYDFLDNFLVKQLEPIKVKKEFSKPVSDNKPSVDKNGIKAVDYDKIETEVKETDSDFRKGVIIKIPMSYERMETKPYDFKIGDVILFKDGRAGYFDLLKDSRLLNYYDIVAIEK